MRYILFLTLGAWSSCSAMNTVTVYRDQIQNNTAALKMALAYYRQFDEKLLTAAHCKSMRFLENLEIQQDHANALFAHDTTSIVHGGLDRALIWISHKDNKMQSRVLKAKDASVSFARCSVMSGAPDRVIAVDTAGYVHGWHVDKETMYARYACPVPGTVAAVRQTSSVPTILFFTDTQGHNRAGVALSKATHVFKEFPDHAVTAVKIDGNQELYKVMKANGNYQVYRTEYDPRDLPEGQEIKLKGIYMAEIIANKEKFAALGVEISEPWHERWIETCNAVQKEQD